MESRDETMKIVALQDDGRQYLNNGYCSPNQIARFPGSSTFTFGKQKAKYLACMNNRLVLRIKKDPRVEEGNVALNRLQVEYLRTLDGAEVSVKPFVPPAQFKLATMSVRVDVPKVGTLKISSSKLEKKISNCLEGQVINVGQKILVVVHKQVLCFEVVRLTLSGNTSTKQGLVFDMTKIFVRATGSALTILNPRRYPRQTFQRDISLDDLEQSLIFAGIGGMDDNFREIVVKAFASRYLPAGLMDTLGYNHVRGMLLYGPPGTGKTLLARTMAKFFDAKIKVINGPEVYSSYVGDSEKNIREVFEDAFTDYKEHGENSDLHFIIFDELDSIGRKRGGSMGRYQDTALNQLLTMIDGVSKLNNIFVIGTTNRVDLIDPALLRPGRLQLKLNIDVPDRNGRLQILDIYTQKLRQGNLIAADVNLEEIAAKTDRWSGAELESAVTSAFSLATVRATRSGLFSISKENIEVKHTDFIEALESVNPLIEKPLFEYLNKCRNDRIEGLSSLEVIFTEAQQLIKRMQTSGQLSTCLLAGPSGSGKSSLSGAIALEVALEDPREHVDIISSSSLSGLSESQICSKIQQVFANALALPQSIIILDDIEWIVRYYAVKPNFSSMIAFTVMNQLKIVPPEGRSITVLATTSCLDVIHRIGLAGAFCVHFTIKPLENEDIQKVLDHFQVPQDGITRVLEKFHAIPVKKLCELVQMARTGSDAIDEKSLLDVMKYFKF